MQIIVVTPAGKLYDEQVDYVVVASHLTGQFALMKNHTPVISSIDRGYVKMVKEDTNLVTVILNGVVEFSNNIVNVIAQEAHIGYTEQSAMEHLLSVRKERLEENKRRSIDFGKAEKDLVENIQKAKASKV
jgi:F-type H+-transporting ATPase subunit epsilon